MDFDTPFSHQGDCPVELLEKLRVQAEWGYELYGYSQQILAGSKTEEEFVSEILSKITYNTYFRGLEVSLSSHEHPSLLKDLQSRLITESESIREDSIKRRNQSILKRDMAAFRKKLKKLRVDLPDLSEIGKAKRVKSMMVGAESLIPHLTSEEKNLLGLKP